MARVGNFRNLCLGILLFLGLHGVAWAAPPKDPCVPNPNANGPLFIDGCPIPAAGLNNFMKPTSKFWGADPTGAVDATAAVQSCLAYVGAGSTCYITPGAKLLILGNLVIPPQTGLDCRLPFPDNGDAGAANWATMPAILLDSAHQIKAGGPGVNIKNCLIIRNGMTFPITGFGAYAGTAINGQGFTGLTVEDVTILGFDVAIYGYGSGRMHLQRVYADCTGVTFPCIYSGGPSDAVTMKDIKIESLTSGPSPTCANRIRPGTGLGFLNGTGAFLEDVIVQDFGTIDLSFQNTVVTASGTVVADFFAPTIGSPCSNTAIGVYINGVQALAFANLQTNTMQTGVFVSNTYPASVSIGYLFQNAHGQDCLLFGDGVTHGGGVLNIGYHDAQNFAGGQGPCGRYAVNYNDTNGGSLINIGYANYAHVNGGAAPYIYVGATVGIKDQINIAKIDVDLVNTNPYGGSQPIMTTVNAAAALNLSNLTDYYLVNGTTNITSLGGMWPGREVTLYFNGILTVTNGNNIQMAGGANFVTQFGSMIRFFCYSTNASAVNCKEEWRSS